MGNTKVQAILASVPLFKEMNAEEIDLVARGTRELHLSRGQMVVQRGDPSTGFYLVVHGQVKLAVSSPNGLEKVVHLVGSGQSFGEAVMFMGMPYPVYAQALVDSLLLHISRSVVFEGIDRDTSFCRKMLAGLSSRLHSLIGDVESYSLRSSTQRVIGFLLQHEGEAPEAGGKTSINLPASKSVIASRLNITPETFSRALHELITAGLIAVHGREVSILNLEGLRTYGQY